MDNNWAAEHLQTIRTLMERAAVYRRALAPIMIFVGAIGTTAGVVGCWLPITSMMAFGAYWFGVAFVAVAVAFLLARRQAIKDREPFWSPPTRRVTQALLPGLVSGLCFVLPVCLAGEEDLIPFFVVPCAFFYGCAVHAAGFFMPRGMKLFGWTVIASAIAMLGVLVVLSEKGVDLNLQIGSLEMGFVFGLLHLAYGAYLWISERGKQAV